MAEGLQIYLDAVTRLHERMDGLASKKDVDQVRDAVKEVNGTVARMEVTLVGNYVTKEDADKRCGACEKERVAEGSRRRWVAGYTVTVAMAVVGIITLIWRFFGGG